MANQRRDPLSTRRLDRGRGERVVLSGPAAESSTFEHMVDLHNWTTDELRQIMGRLGTTAWKIHRFEHDEHGDFWEHEHG